LREGTDQLTSAIVSAAEIIEMIKKLPPGEQAEVAAFLKATESNQSPTKVAPNAEFERAAKRVFSDNDDLLRRLAQ
jgi:hypothetical protein